MSTIEEAREQAREALEQQTRAVLEGYGMSAIAVNLRDALRDLLDATEPPETFGQCDECGFYACSCLTSSHADKPAEDEREALIATRKLVHEVLEQSRTLPLDVQSAQVMLVLLDAGYSKGPRPITDEMVDAADFAIMPYWGERYPSGSLTTEIARAALEAAEEARR